MDILNNILDKAHNYLILLEARNTGLIAINLGVISFYYSSAKTLKILILLLCILGILLLALSFINFKSKETMKKAEIEEAVEEINVKEPNQVISSNNSVLGIGSIGIKRTENTKNNSIAMIPNDHLEKNIYNIKDISSLNTSEYLNLVSEKIEVKGDKLLNHIKKEYRFTPASKDLAAEILDTARSCRFKEKVFYIGLYLFILNVIFMLIDNVIL